MIETEAIDQVLVTNEAVMPRRVDHPHRPVADHPQPRITGVERVPRHRSEIDQLVAGSLEASEADNVAMSVTRSWPRSRQSSRSGAPARSWRRSRGRRGPT